jgi:septum formation protein
MMSHPTSALPVLYLASASPRRRALLDQIGVAHEVAPAEIDETRRPEEPPREYVLRLAREKALAVRAARAGRPVLAADTAVVLGPTVYGKPRDREDALAMLAALGGRTHQVLTAVALAAGEERLTSALSESTVELRALSAAECRAYWDTGEPADKAGAYAIQGLGAVFVRALHGSFSGVMGLPLYETAELLRAAGVPCWLGRASPPAAGSVPRL